jgi:hypothetical protein
MRSFWDYFSWLDGTLIFIERVAFVINAAIFCVVVLLCFALIFAGLL